jgi:hypothetical protein
MENMELGPQPLDSLIDAWGLGNHDLVEASTEQLTHKQTQRARKGRRLSLKMMQKLARALNVAIWQRLSDEERATYFEYFHKHLFNYAKGYEATWTDPNIAMMATVAEGGRKLRKN